MGRRISQAPAQRLSQRQRVAAYAVIRRGDQVLLSRLAPYLSAEERWTLPGGGIDFGEHPRDAAVREVYEETGLRASVGDNAWIDSARRQLTREQSELHSVRMVFEGWVPSDSPDPHVVEVDGSTADAGWHPVAGVLDGSIPTVPMVAAALEALRPARLQRLAAYALVRRGDEVLLTRISRRGFHTGAWTLPGGGVGHGESPEDALRREVIEETGCSVVPGALLGVHDVHFAGNAPSGRFEDFHGVHLVYAAELAERSPLRVTEEDGTTDAVAWVPLADIAAKRIEVLGVVDAALAWAP